MRTAWLVLALATLSVPLALSQEGTGGTAPTVEALAAFLEGRGEQVARGAQLFDDACSNCHGDTGLGFEEAVRSFPAEELPCTRCHRPTNPPQMPFESMTPRDAFDIGEPPTLAGEGHGLAKYGNGLGLYSYIRATMPRWKPGSLDDAGYLDITAFLLELSGTPLAGAELLESNAADFPIGR